jgi:hypothetical protein
MPTDIESKTCVEAIRLAQDIDQRVAQATVRLGDATLRGVTVWRSRNGRLSVLFPSYKLGAGWCDAIELPAELRSQVEADVISAYKEAKAAAQAEQRQKSEPLKHSHPARK